jgi:D-alanyl-lipoteichoic acid acyltransferase DltB (MBOAT superfamily)
MLSGLFFQFTFSFHPKLAVDFSWRDFWLGFFSYPCFMYFNFSGFCDVVIGMGWILGLENKENFNRPFAARNIREYWKRWHISLTELLQAMIFNPLAKGIYRFRKPFLIRHSAPALTFLVFLLIGLWHGFEWKYFWFGVWHATGLTAYHYWKLLTHSRSEAILRNSLIANIKMGLSWVLTMAFVSTGFFIFENSPDRMLEIFRMLMNNY